MEEITYTKARQNMVSLMEQVIEQRLPIEITRRGHESVVLLSKADYEKLKTRPFEQKETK